MKKSNIAIVLAYLFLFLGTAITIPNIKLHSRYAGLGISIIGISLLFATYSMKRYFSIRWRYEKTWVEVLFDWLYNSNLVREQSW